MQIVMRIIMWCDIKVKHILVKQVVALHFVLNIMQQAISIPFIFSL